jgi:hypothetical protein
LVKKCSAYKHADTEIKELILCIVNRWIKTEEQLKRLRALSSELGDELCMHEDQVLQILQGKLAEGIALVDGVIGEESGQPTIRSIVTKPGTIKRMKYALRLKACIEKIIQEIDRWHALFDPSWLLLLRLSNPIIKQETLEDSSNVPNDLISEVKSLQIAIIANSKDQNSVNPIFIPDEDISTVTAVQTMIPFSGARQIQDEKGANLILDDDCQSTEKDARDLARVLMCPGMGKFGLLTCVGVLKATRFNPGSGLHFLFQIPTGLSKPTTLRQLLLKGTEASLACSLNSRFKLGLNLAKAVLLFHSTQFVHKSIRPETVLVFDSDDGKFGNSFLLGFGKFRLENAKTYMRGDDTWSTNIYRHPRRQGLHPEEEYTMQHDIYALGVNLLEIGLWESFTIRKSESDSSSNTDREFRPALFLAIEELLKLKDTRAKAFAIKKRLVEITKQQLPFKTGEKYANIVLDCLTCLDPDNERFGNQAELQDQDGIAVGVRYIEKVIESPKLLKLRLTFIDFDGPGGDQYLGRQLGYNISYIGYSTGHKGRSLASGLSHREALLGWCN